MSRGQSRDRLRGSFAEVLRGQAEGLQMLAEQAGDEGVRDALHGELERIRDTARYLGVGSVLNAATRALRANEVGEPGAAIEELVEACRALPGLETVFRPIVLLSPRLAPMVGSVREEYAAELRLAESPEHALALARKRTPSALVVEAELLGALREQLDPALRAVPLYVVGPEGELDARVGAARMGIESWFAEPVRLESVLARIRAQVTEADPPPYRVLVVEPDGARWSEVQVLLDSPERQLWRLRDGREVLDALDRLVPELILTAADAGSVSGAELAEAVRSHERIADTPIIVLGDDEALEHTGVLASVDDVLVRPFAPVSLRSRVAARLQRVRVERRAREVDALTGVLTRGALLRAADREVRLAKRNQTPLSVVMLDVDGTKAANEAGGLEAGDRLLLTLAEVLRGALRETDIIGRLGGDSFGVLMPQCRSEDAWRRFDQVREQARDRAEVDGLARLEFSSGIADTRGGLADVLYRADRALHQARRAGGGRSEVAD